MDFFISVWGLLLAYTQDMFYLEDPGELRDRSVTVAYLYIALAVIAFLSATTQFLGVAQVSTNLEENIWCICTLIRGNYRIP